ncbi:C40 family peptidase [Planotetraspora sp. A-T 1434]|uniref:C40 family peptidase n=1 Tax=Planotetraspora sp. A-T 1434 TaxID=2979219 RepID=UPI0021C203E6|nr:C40 family peptidase [Planotetraspora sp. A-T 1434]MCT9929816.1 C40 family peptidase [Planotetraspora sp. A-T 1434]
MIIETRLTKVLVAGGSLAAGVVLLAGLSVSARFAAIPARAMCDYTSPAADQPRSSQVRKTPPMTAIGLCPELSRGQISVEAAAGAEPGMIAVQAALRMRGIPYAWGGGGPAGPSFGIGRGAQTRGFDCSGLAEYAWAKAGARIGGDTSAQWKTGIHVPRSQIRAGDLIFFAYNTANPRTIHHVGIAIDATHMVHAPHTGSTVRIDT